MNTLNKDINSLKIPSIAILNKILSIENSKEIDLYWVFMIDINEYYQTISNM